MIVKIVFWYNALNNYLLQCLSQRRCLVTGEVNAGGGGNPSSVKASHPGGISVDISCHLLCKQGTVDNC